MIYESEIANSLHTIHQTCKKEVKQLALTHINNMLKEFRKYYDFDKYVYHIYWDGSYEDIHSFSSFGNLEESFFVESCVGDSCRDKYIEFFEGSKFPDVDINDKSDLEFSLEYIMVESVGFYVMTATLQEDGNFDIVLTTEHELLSDGEFTLFD